MASTSDWLHAAHIIRKEWSVGGSVNHQHLFRSELEGWGSGNYAMPTPYY